MRLLIAIAVVLWPIQVAAHVVEILAKIGSIKCEPDMIFVAVAIDRIVPDQNADCEPSESAVVLAVDALEPRLFNLSGTYRDSTWVVTGSSLPPRTSAGRCVDGAACGCDDAWAHATVAKRNFDLQKGDTSIPRLQHLVRCSLIEDVGAKLLHSDFSGYGYSLDRSLGGSAAGLERPVDQHHRVDADHRGKHGKEGHRPLRQAVPIEREFARAGHDWRVPVIALLLHIAAGCIGYLLACRTIRDLEDDCQQHDRHQR